MIHKLERIQNIKAPLKKVWDFFSTPKNLQSLTPAYMKFTVTSGPLPDEIYAGQIITYKVSPIMGIPLFWMTEITHVIREQRFIDEQRRGPYRLWHHQHHFKEVDGITEMHDIVHYELPLGFLGNAANALLVKKQLMDIFNYRERKTEELLQNL